jgi:alpha-1,2-mannosyltransferase
VADGGVDGTMVRPGFTRRAALAVLAALAAALVLIVVTADGPDTVSGGLGGDYPSFYGAGKILLDDPGLDPERFYEPAVQFEAQAPFLPSDADGNLFFGYPTFFATPYILLATVDFELSYLFHVLVMAGAVVAALHVVRPCSRIVRDHFVETLAASLSFFPLFRAVTGGQNAALSLLAFAVVWRSLHDGREIPAGVAAGLLLFKPPLALPVIGGLLLARRFRAVAAAAGTALGLYVVGALLTGPGWPSAWVDAVRYLDDVDTPFNVQNFVSLPGVAEAVFGIDSTAATVVGYGLALVVAVIISAWWTRRDRDPGSLVAVMAAGSLLVSPHALYYDAGVLVLVGVVVAERRPDLRQWLVLLWAGGLLHLLAEPLGVDPLVVVVVAAFVLALESTASETTGDSSGVDAAQLRSPP